MLIQQATRTAAVLLCKPVNFLEAKHCLGRAIAGAGVSGCAFGERTSLYVVRSVDHRLSQILIRSALLVGFWPKADLHRELLIRVGAPGGARE